VYQERRRDDMSLEDGVIVRAPSPDTKRAAELREELRDALDHSSEYGPGFWTYIDKLHKEIIKELNGFDPYKDHEEE
jgi:hypothetical protein